MKLKNLTNALINTKCEICIMITTRDYEHVKYTRTLCDIDSMDVTSTVGYDNSMKLGVSIFEPTKKGHITIHTYYKCESLGEFEEMVKTIEMMNGGVINA